MKKLTQKQLKARKKLFTKPALASMAVASAMAVMTYDARANVYATDILVNGAFPPVGSVAASLNTPVSISYHLNQAATLGVTVYIMQGNSIVASITGGTAMGLNTVSWTPTSTGTFSISITAAAADVSGGTTNWTQISVDSTNTAAVYPLGIDVDKNTNSAYYGRVVVGNAIDGSANGATQMVGLYKANADGTPADEGGFGYAGYTTNDDGQVGVGEMSSTGETYHDDLLPDLVRIGSDDRIYFMDTSEVGAVIATDMQATTNQIVINEGPGGAGNITASKGYPNCTNDYSGLPSAYASLLNATYGPGWGQFDVAGFESGSPAVYIFDYQDYPSAGVWMYHMTNGAADPADTVGTLVMGPDQNAIYNPRGFSADTNLDLFIGQNRSNGDDPLERVFEFANWNLGVLPAEGSGTADAVTDTAFAWAEGGGDTNLTGINNVAINSRTDPTLVAVAMEYGAVTSGIAILSATNMGSYVATNLDSTNYYTAVAFDNVGNAYGCSTTANYWRAWSPPGANTNTTAAVENIVVSAPFKITGITAVPTTPGCSTVTITFTGPALAASAFSVYGSPTVSGTYTVVAGATITGSAGSYQAVFSNCSTEFYVIEH